MAPSSRGRSGWDARWASYPASRPLRTSEGIATSKKRGPMAGTWWSKRFVDVLESYGLGGRMTRGRAYARSGQVLSLDVTAGLLVAQVQGSRRVPYAVTVRITTPTGAQWRKIDDLLRARAGHAASMLAGEIPRELEDVFTQARCALFPAAWRDLRATCSCPDWGDPCKHQAAVLYVFADRLDGDPWQLLAWHGRTRDDIVGLFAVTGATDDEAGAVAPWWPLRPGTGPMGRAPRLPDPALGEPGAVLSRLGGSGITAEKGVPVEDLLRSAYLSLADHLIDESARVR